MDIPAENRIQGLYCVDPLQVSAEIGSDPIYKTARFTIRPVLAALQPAINCFYLLKKEKASCPLRSTWMR